MPYYRPMTVSAVRLRNECYGVLLWWKYLIIHKRCNSGNCTMRNTNEFSQVKVFSFRNVPWLSIAIVNTLYVLWLHCCIVNTLLCIVITLLHCKYAVMYCDYTAALWMHCIVNALHCECTALWMHCIVNALHYTYTSFVFIQRGSYSHQFRLHLI